MQVDFRQKFINELKDKYLDKPSNVEKIDNAAQIINNWMTISLSQLKEIDEKTDDLQLNVSNTTRGMIASIRYLGKELSFERNEDDFILVYVDGDVIDTIGVFANEQVVSLKTKEDCNILLLDKYLKIAFDEIL